MLQLNAAIGSLKKAFLPLTKRWDVAVSYCTRQALGEASGGRLESLLHYVWFTVSSIVLGCRDGNETNDIKKYAHG
jgi:hypothetical protein